MNELAQGVGSSFQTAAASGPLLLAVAACILAGLVSFAIAVCGAARSRISVVSGRHFRS